MRIHEIGAGEKMSLNEQTTILLIGNDTALNYLFGRFAERCGYQLVVSLEKASAKEVTAVSPVMIVFPSLETLESFQSLVGELANLDFPIMVCSSVADEVRARELGADYCLTHPFSFDDFQATLTTVNASKRA
jgi:DNA-binding response OmpR family regulator